MTSIRSPGGMPDAGGFDFFFQVRRTDLLLKASTRTRRYKTAIILSWSEKPRSQDPAARPGFARFLRRASGFALSLRTKAFTAQAPRSRPSVG